MTPKGFAAGGCDYLSASDLEVEVEAWALTVLSEVVIVDEEGVKVGRETDKAEKQPHVFRDLKRYNFADIKQKRRPARAK